jgi:Trypsin-like peptidase domain/MAP3K TRAFs-binding domain
VAWDPANSPVELRAAIKTLDQPRVGELCGELIAHLHNAETPYSPDAAKAILGDLRRKRHFALMQQVADAFIQSGLDDPAIRRHYAQALLDQGNMIAAVAVLERLVPDTAGAGVENAEARGLLGRAYKQMYVVSGPGAGERRRLFLERAIAQYRDVYEESPDYRWHGINAVALLARAQRDGVKLATVDDAAADARDLATEILAAIDGLGDSASMWDHGTAMEASIALGDTKAALAQLNSYLASDADAFELASTLRQLTEVWDLDPTTDPGSQLIPLLKSAVLRYGGGAADEANADVGIGSSDIDNATRKPIERGQGYEKVFGQESFDSLMWFRTAIERCRAVARVEDPFEKPMGTGFLVKGADVHPNFPPVVLVTNAHVISTEYQMALHPDNARVTFRALEDSDVAYRVTRLLWSSPPNQLDATVVELDGYPAAATRCPVGPKPQLPADPPPQTYIIGHPGGMGEVMLSVRDNVLLDADDLRVHYRTPTLGGSSGSPVFDKFWNLIALHHSGLTRMSRLHGEQGTYPANEGIWFERIKQKVCTELG